MKWAELGMKKFQMEISEIKNVRNDLHEINGNLGL